MDYVIGVDFDNTIVSYDEVFHHVALQKGLIPAGTLKRKMEIRDRIRKLSAGETTWIRLQGIVYGKFMQRAEIMPGVANFLLQCKVRNHSVFIVSHKTEYGHFDCDNVSLRQEALKWMESKRLADGGDADAARRATTLYEQIKRIRMGEKPISAELQVLRLGPLAIVGIPGELCADLGQEIRQKSAAPFTVLSLYSNGYLGYNASLVDHALGGYEVGLGR